MLKGGVISESLSLSRSLVSPGLPLTTSSFFSPSLVDVVNVEQAKIAEAAGACAVMVSQISLFSNFRTVSLTPFSSRAQALQRIPSDIRRDGGVARMSDPQMIKEIMAAVSIPVSRLCFQFLDSLTELNSNILSGHGQISYRSHRRG